MQTNLIERHVPSGLYVMGTNVESRSRDAIAADAQGVQRFPSTVGFHHDVGEGMQP
jgi:hypothetical protein